MGHVSVTVLYDERCAFCTRLAQRLARRSERIAIAEIGSPAGDRWLRDLDVKERYAQVHAVDELGRRLSGGRAVPAVLRLLPGGTWAAAPAAALPAVTDALYRLVARHRGRLGRLLR